MSKILLVFLLFAVYNSKAQEPSLLKALDSLILKEGETLNFSGSVIVAEGDKIFLAKSIGYADRDKNILNDTTTKFNIASVGKLFTQVVILQLLEEGKIKLTDTVGTFFTGFNRPNARQITIFHLLTHSAGLNDVYTSSGYLNLDDLSSQEEVIKIIADEKLKFVPGSQTDYSNSGYYLLGAIASRVENKPFEEVVKDRIFIPLRMKSSGFASTGEYVEHHALPYEKKGAKISQLKPKLIGDPPSGAGSEFCSAPDLFRFYSALIYSNDLLADSSKALIFNRFLPVAWTDILSSGKIFGFVGGDTRGWSAKLTFMFLKKRIYGVIVLANFDNMANELDQKLRPEIQKS